MAVAAVEPAAAPAVRVVPEAMVVAPEVMVAAQAAPVAAVMVVALAVVERAAEAQVVPAAAPAVRAQRHRATRSARYPRAPATSFLPSVEPCPASVHSCLR
jgi:hypothetical protein